MLLAEQLAIAFLVRRNTRPNSVQTIIDTTSKPSATWSGTTTLLAIWDRRLRGGAEAVEKTLANLKLNISPATVQVRTHFYRSWSSTRSFWKIVKHLVSANFNDASKLVSSSYHVYKDTFQVRESIGDCRPPVRISHWNLCRSQADNMCNSLQTQIFPASESSDSRFFI